MEVATDELAQAVIGDVSACPCVAAVQYEYLDHTADVQLHTWGQDFTIALQQLAMAMFGYMTEIDSVDVVYTYDITATGDDEKGLVFHFLDEWLFAFSADPFFIPRIVKILDLSRNEESEEWTVRARGWGESFDIKKHPQGTEVKAITYSNMQIHNKVDTKDSKDDKNCELFVIIDI